MIKALLITTAREITTDMAKTSDELELPVRMHPVIAMLAFLPMMALILILLTLVVEKTPPIPLLVLFTAVAGCCVMLSWTALKTMLGGRLTLTSEGLKVNHLLSEVIYPWPMIDACKVMPATGTFGDDALVEPEDRVGLGLFLKGSQRERAHPLDADVVLCAGDKVDVQVMMRLAARVDSTLQKANAHGRRPAANTTVPGALGLSPNSQRQARRPRGQTAADPVAEFRNRATAKTE